MAANRAYKFMFIVVSLFILIVAFDLFFVSTDGMEPLKPYFLELTDSQKAYAKANPDKDA